MKSLKIVAIFVAIFFIVIAIGNVLVAIKEANASAIGGWLCAAIWALTSIFYASTNN